MKGDRERCLAAGMDDYLSKPVRREQLLGIVSAWSGDTTAPGPLTPAEPPPFDRQVVVEQLGDEALLRELACMFVENSAGPLEEIRDSVARSDGPRLAAAAHRLKGTLGYFGPGSAVATLGRLELLGRGPDLTAAPSLVANLERELDRLGAYLAEIQAEDA